MEIKQINDAYGVSAQITTQDVSALKENGVKLIICNRPDGEAEDQPSFDVISSAANKLGLETVSIPFKGGQLSSEQVVEFKTQIDRGLKTHAYCRTGNRCTIIWEESQKL